MTKRIYLSNERDRGSFALISDADYPSLRRIRWTLSVDGYAYNGSYGSMHRMVMKYPDGLVVDHKNGDRLDNRRSNLRAVTRRQNGYNTCKPRTNTTGFKGVIRLKSGRYQARVWSDSVSYDFGIYMTAREAAVAYNRGASQMFGEFARLNDV